MNIDLKKIPFSKAGSYLAISELQENYQGNGNPEGVFLRTVRGGTKSSLIGRIVMTDGGKEAAFQCQASPDELLIKGKNGELCICFADEDTILIKSVGLKTGMRLELLPAVWSMEKADEETIDKKDDWSAPEETGIVFGGYLVNTISPDRRLLLWTQRGNCHQTDDTCLVFQGNELLIVLKEAAASRKISLRSYDYEVSRKASLDNFNDFCRKMPSVPEEYQDTAKLASYVDWSCLVKKSGLLPRDTMLMSKNWMCNVWSWDHCFNAIALADKNPAAAWDQWIVPFELQDEEGRLPDTANDFELGWLFTKPPVHGWALSRMMRVMDLKREQLQEAYDRLERWTNWWFAHRDQDHDGICEYPKGCDSGWDNSTVFRENSSVETPDLQAYLILQMDTLSDLASRLEKREDAIRWKQRADQLLEAMLEHSFENDCPKAVQSGTHQIIPNKSLLLYMPIVLGDRLPEKIRTELLKTLKSDEFLTPNGFTTESVESPFYEADGYWRGPIWAPTTLLLLDGLRKCKEEKLARQVAKAFCRMAQKSGFAENFDAKTGEGLRDRAYSWTASVFLMIAREYL